MRRAARPAQPVAPKTVAARYWTALVPPSRQQDVDATHRERGKSCAQQGMAISIMPPPNESKNCWPTLFCTA